MIEIKQILIPVALFIFIAIVVIIALNLIFQYLQRRLALETVKQVLGKEQKVDPSLIEAIVKDPSEPNNDLRKGMILLATAIATSIFAWIMSNMGYPQALNAILGIAAFPGLIGITYIGFHLLAQKNNFS